MKPPAIKVMVKPLPAPDDPSFDASIPDLVRAASITEALEDVCRDLTLRAGWDQPHHLAFVYQRGRSPVGAQLGVDVVQLEYRPLVDSFAALLRYERPHHAVVALASGMREDQELVAAMMPDDLIAVALTTEAWQLVPKTRAEADAQKSYRDKRLIHTHPDRVECRMITAVDVDHVRYGISQPRGGSPMHMVGMGRGSKTYYAGDVPNALEYLMWVMQGRTVEDWPEWWRKHYNYPAQEDEAMKRWEEGQ